MTDKSDKGVNRRTIAIEFGDCDPARIVYYPNYFRWFDQGTHHLFAAAGFPLAQLAAARGLTIPLVGAKADFRGPASWGDTIAIESRIARWGNRAFDIAHTVSHAATGAPVAEGSETRVCVALDPADPKGIRGVPIPDDIRAALGG
jgi:4-hydroxybenzoyl-CoA thioesterase